MALHEQIRQAIAASINDCIRNDTSFGSYADAATEAVMEVLAKQEPVAWRTFDGEGGYDYRSFTDNEDYQVSWEARNPNHKGWVEPLSLTSGAQAQPAPSDEYVGWYCAHCQRGVDASEVTYHEQHEACGRVITDDRPPKPEAQPAPNFADAYLGAMEEVAIWKKRALEAEDLNRKFVAEINGPVYMGEPAQPAPSVPDGWKLVPIEPTTEIRKAMHYAYWQSPQLPYHDGSPALWNAAYAAMLAAASESPPCP